MWPHGFAVFFVVILLASGCVERSSEDKLHETLTRAKLTYIKELYQRAREAGASFPKLESATQIVNECRSRNLLPPEAIDWDRLDIDGWGRKISFEPTTDGVEMRSSGSNGIAEVHGGDDIVMMLLPSQ